MKYVVGYLDFFDNEMLLEQIQADSPEDAVAKHSKLSKSFLPAKLEEMQEHLFNSDTVIDVLEIE